MERLAAEFSDDPDRIIPEPGSLETGRAYREKKAKPLLSKIVKVLRSVYAAYIDLKSKHDRLKADYNRVRESSYRLSDRLQQVKLENNSLRGIAANYERVKRAFGAQEVEAALETTHQIVSKDIEKFQYLWYTFNINCGRVISCSMTISVFSAPLPTRIAFKFWNCCAAANNAPVFC